MSVEIPENMEEVAMQLAQHQVRGEQVDEKGCYSKCCSGYTPSIF